MHVNYKNITGFIFTLICLIGLTACNHQNNHDENNAENNDKVSTTTTRDKTPSDKTQASNSDKPINNDLAFANLGKVINKNFSSSIPFEWSGGLPLIKVNIEGKDYRFLFDTAAPTTIPEHLVEELKLQRLGKPVILNDSAGRQLDRSLYQLPLLKIADIGFKDFVTFTGDFNNSFPLSCLGFDGILGYNYLKDLKVKLDYTHQTITFSDQAIPHDGFVPIQIQFKPIHGPLIKVNFPFGKVIFELDTGKNANIQLGDPRVIPDMDKQAYAYRETHGAFSSSIGGSNAGKERTYLAKDFSLGSGDSILPIKSFPISVDNSHAFLIGNGFLKHFTIILDLPEQKAYFKNNSESIDEGYSDSFGFTPFWNEKDGLFISAITDKTPATQASLKVGDKILSLNGKDVSKIDKNGFCKILLQYDSDASMNKQSSLEITVQHGDNAPESILLKK